MKRKGKESKAFSDRESYSLKACEKTGENLGHQP